MVFFNTVTLDDTGMFSVGQCLRIRVGPLKGYLCRVLAVRRTDVTVKLDSQQKILTGVLTNSCIFCDTTHVCMLKSICCTFVVKSDNLSEVRGRNAAAAASGYSSI